VTDERGIVTTVEVVESSAVIEPLAGAAGAVRLRSADGGIRSAIVLPMAGRPGAPTRSEVVVDGWRFVLTIEDEEHASLRDRARRAASDLSHAAKQEIRSVIPGRIVGVDVVEGDVVARGDRLLVVEAMKMQNEIRSPRDATVVRLGVSTGGTVEIGSLLVELA
jgi:biotin carboxyl carrier protein